MHKADFKVIKREEVVKTAEAMKSRGSSLAVMTVYAEKDGQPVVCYSYDAGGNIETYKLTGENSIPSITDVYGVAAEWFEEEIEELMDVKFQGLERKGRLFLPDDFDGSGQIIVSPLSELKKNK